MLNPSYSLHAGSPAMMLAILIPPGARTLEIGETVRVARRGLERPTGSVDPMALASWLARPHLPNVRRSCQPTTR
jgi:hypothetical protein